MEEAAENARLTDGELRLISNEEATPSFLDAFPPADDDEEPDPNSESLRARVEAYVSVRLVHAAGARIPWDRTAGERSGWPAFDFCQGGAVFSYARAAAGYGDRRARRRCSGIVPDQS